MSLRSVAAAVAASMLAGPPTPPPTRQWPQVQEVEFIQALRFGPAPIHVSVPVRDRSGRIRYRLTCRGGTVEQMDAIAGQTEDIYLRDLDCQLHPGDGEGATLLGEDDSPSWHTRGRFLLEDIVGACGRYPQFGSDRTFRLRGFVLRLTLEPRGEWDSRQPPVREALLGVSVRRDSRAVTAIAEPSGYINPRRARRGCTAPMPGHEQTMCRNAQTFSWEPCRAGHNLEPYRWEEDPFAY